MEILHGEVEFALPKIFELKLVNSEVINGRSAGTIQVPGIGCYLGRLSRDQAETKNPCQCKGLVLFSSTTGSLQQPDSHASFSCDITFISCDIPFVGVLWLCLF